MSRSRVLLGMSGGVDSSAAALVLQQQGYDVVGCTLDMFSEATDPHVRTLSDSAQKAIAEAQAVCKKLGIPHVSLQAGEAFQYYVVDAFCDLYWNGATPNPCVLCNPTVKFALMENAREHYGCDFLATGHYVQSGFDETVQRFWLGRAQDRAKDQSYFLYALNQKILSHCIFPLGTFTKQEVRVLARDAQLESAQKPESQDICFIQTGNHIDFLLNTRDQLPKPGPIVDLSGNVLGQHDGLINYTIGQRKGIGIAAAEPLYVFKKDLETNTLIVDFDHNTKVKSIEVEHINYVSTAPGSDTLSEEAYIEVKTHYRQTPQRAHTKLRNNDRLTIVFEEPQRACAPGQAAVCYFEDRVLYGGVISSSDSYDR